MRKWYLMEYSNLTMKYDSIKNIVFSVSLHWLVSFWHEILKTMLKKKKWGLHWKVETNSSDFIKQVNWNRHSD